jgi:hypothetical protein
MISHLVHKFVGPHMVVAVHLYTMKEPESDPKTLYTKSDYTPNIILTKENKRKTFYIKYCCHKIAHLFYMEYCNHELADLLRLPP